MTHSPVPDVPGNSAVPMKPSSRSTETLNELFIIMRHIRCHLMTSAQNHISLASCKLYLGFVFLLLPGLHRGHSSPSSLARNSLCPNLEGPTSPLVHPSAGWSSEACYLYQSLPLLSGPPGEWSKVTSTESINVRMGHLKVLICLFGEYFSSFLLTHWYFKAPQPLKKQKQSPVDLSERQKGDMRALWRAGFPDSKQEMSLGVGTGEEAAVQEVRREQRALNGKVIRKLSSVSRDGA